MNLSFARKWPAGMLILHLSCTSGLKLVNFSVVCVRVVVKDICKNGHQIMEINDKLSTKSAKY